MSGSIRLREVAAADLDAFYEHQSDPIAFREVGLVPRDLAAFEAHWAAVVVDRSVVLRSILADEKLAGHVASFLRQDKREVCYWIDRHLWGRGIATEALRLLLQEVLERLYARVAKDHVRSQRVLLKCGFVICGEDKCPAGARGEETDEWIFELRT